MDRIEFRLEEHRNYGRVVGILINAVSLAKRAEDFELPRYRLKSGYAGLPVADLASVRTYFLGSPAPHGGHEGRLQLLGCGCGESGCWPLTCRMCVGPTVVTWSDFLQPFRAKGSAGGYWGYDGFGPFSFDRRQYEQALSGLDAPVET